ncbi:hypothetical protein MASSI9I_90417 [Massilia sp. 9I]|nr:hypothetical protein MASSI9I_90417 [Massilia sp. 9I]
MQNASIICIYGKLIPLLYLAHAIQDAPNARRPRGYLSEQPRLGRHARSALRDCPPALPGAVRRSAAAYAGDLARATGRSASVPARQAGRGTLH